MLDCSGYWRTHSRTLSNYYTNGRTTPWLWQWSMVPLSSLAELAISVFLFLHPGAHCVSLPYLCVCVCLYPLLCVASGASFFISPSWRRLVVVLCCIQETVESVGESCEHIVNISVRMKENLCERWLFASGAGIVITEGFKTYWNCFHLVVFCIVNKLTVTIQQVLWLGPAFCCTTWYKYHFRVKHCWSLLSQFDWIIKWCNGFVISPEIWSLWCFGW